MYLVLSQVESGDGLVFMHGKGHMSIILHGTDVVPELSPVAAVARGSELELADDPDVLGDGVACDPEGYLQVGFIDDCCGCDLKMNDREVG